MKVFLSFILIIYNIDVMAQQASFENAHQAVHNMSIGWNLGNTLESCNFKQDSLIEKTTDCSVKAYETAWGQPQATRELMHKFAETGFKTIYICESNDYSFNYQSLTDKQNFNR